jgi:predicted PurR-regulated permease PerM
MANEHRGVRVLLILTCTVVVLAGLKAAAAMLLPMLVAVFLTVLSIPPMRRLERHGFPEWLALVTVVIAATFLVFLVTFVVGNSIEQFQGSLDDYKRRLFAIAAEAGAWLNERGIEVDPDDLASRIDSGALMELAADTASELLGAFSNLVLVLLTMIFMLLETNSFKHKVERIMGPNADLGEFANAAKQVQRYLSTKAVVSLATGALISISCFALGVDFPLLWGLLAFLFNFVPNIGSIVAAVPAVLLALLQLGAGTAGILGLCYLVVNVVIGNIVEPKLMGRRLGLSTLVVFLSMVFWGWIWGPVGMLLSVPLTVIVKLLLEHSSDFRSVAILLGTGVEDLAPLQTREGS